MSASLPNVPMNDRRQAGVQPILELAPSARRRRISFIEKKFPNLDELNEILRPCAESGQWANFGPISSLLESTLARHVNLHPSRAVVMCSSATAALLTITAMKNYRAGRRLRWVISAYGFRSTRLGPLADALVLDCNQRAMLDFDRLAALDPGTWDGVVLTNVFGLTPDIRDYVDLCGRLGKELILDNAGLLDGFPRQDSSCCVDEILSFHQTKPWGMGEGGCAILANDDAQLFRQFTNMGKGLEPMSLEGASNSKISDFSCALILQRLLQEPQWASCYQVQAGRVLKIAERIGLRPLAPMDLTRLTPPHVPLLARDPVTEANLDNETLTLHKYYTPLSNTARQAGQIYERIVNVPCHPDLAALSDEELGACLQAVTGGRV